MFLRRLYVLSLLVQRKVSSRHNLVFLPRMVVASEMNGHSCHQDCIDSFVDGLDLLRKSALR
jgi:hypothetical protein